LNAGPNIEQAFAAAMAEQRLSPEEIIGDGAFHRFDGPQDKRGKRNAWYVLHLADDIAWGAFGDWKAGIDGKWCSRSESGMTHEEKRARREKLKRLAAAIDAERERKAVEARAKVAEQWARAGAVKADHPYVIRKGIRPFGAKQMRDAVLVPLFDMTGEQHSMQYIQAKPDEDGKDRSFKSGGRVRGCFCPIGDMPDDGATILIAEGWATACSLHQASGRTVLAAMFADNLLPVAKAARERYPNAHIVVCADDDWETKGNPGMTKAQAAALAIDGTLASPNFGSDRSEGTTDFNDMHQLLGAEAVRRAIEDASFVDGGAQDSAGVDTTRVCVDGFPTLEERPCYRVYEDWQEVDGRKMKPGVYLHTTKAERTDAPPSLIDKWISTPLRVLATTSNGEDAEYGRLLEIRSPAGKWKPWAMPMAMLAGDGSDALGVLMSEGLIPYFNDKKAVLRYVAEQVPSARMRAASVTGWSGDAFVLPNTVIGADDIWFQASGRTAPYASGGTFDEWRALAALAPGNPLLMLAFSGALAGPLLGPLNVDGGGAHLYGDSSSGKTTALHAAVSVWGGPAFKRTWRATANGLEGTGSLHSDTLLALDELGEIDPKSLYEAAYALINGTGKTRANRHGEARQASRWRVFLLSTGELTIAARMSAGGIEAKAGQELRILDVPVCGKHGLFDNLHGRASGAALSDEVRNLAARHYGHAGPRFVTELVSALRGGLNLADELHPMLERFGVEGQERRAARTFAICGLAGELAARWNIVPWKTGIALKAAMHAFELWRRRRGANEHGVEHAAILRSLADFIDKYSDSRFSNIDGSVDLVRERAGYWRQDGDRRSYLFTSGGLKEATRGYDLMRVLAALEKAKAFAATDLDKRSKKTRDPTGRAVSLYHIDPDALASDE